MTFTAHFRPNLFKFLRELKVNNTREWFLAHKPLYEGSAREPLPMMRFLTRSFGLPW